MALTRDDVVRAAVILLDEVGLDGLTLRRLAAELGVSAPTLYWHVRHKRELLDLMAEAIIAEGGARTGSPAAGEPWTHWLADQGRMQWRALVAHRDAALVVAGNRPTETSLPYVEESIASLVAAGFSPADALENLFALGHYVIGCALEYQAERARQRQVSAEIEPARHPSRNLAAAPYPSHNLAAPPYSGTAVAERMPDPFASFDHGLRLLVEGMRTRIGAADAGWKPDRKFVPGGRPGQPAG